MSACERDAGEAAAKTVKLFWKQIEAEYNLSPADVPDYSNDDMAFASSSDRATSAAAMLREEWGLELASPDHCTKVKDRSQHIDPKSFVASWLAALLSGVLNQPSVARRIDRPDPLGRGI